MKQAKRVAGWLVMMVVLMVLGAMPGRSVAAAPDAPLAVFEIDISPPNTTAALNAGTNPYSRDHAEGLAAANETGQPVSAATGNETGAGITYDDATNTLTFEFAYGSDFGFSDLTGDFTIAHIHAPGPVNYPAVNSSAGVIINLTGFHTPGSSARTGSFSGNAVLIDAQETNLFNNELYFNIHSSTVGSGEIRGQLIPLAAPTAVQLAAFDAAAGDSSILLTWESSSELDNRGFNLYRSRDPQQRGSARNDALIPSQAPGSGQGARYQWEDSAVEAGVTYYYTLEAVGASGASTWHGPVRGTLAAPTAITLEGFGQGKTPTGGTLALAALALLAGVSLFRRRAAAGGNRSNKAMQE